MATEPDPKRLKFADSTTVLIEVGTGKTRLYDHKKFLCDASTFFEAALEGGFEEVESQKIELPEDKTDMVELFLQWLYAPEYRGLADELLSVSATARNALRQAKDLFIFADKIGAQSLKRQILGMHFKAFKYKRTQRQLVLCGNYGLACGYGATIVVQTRSKADFRKIEKLQ